MYHTAVQQQQSVQGMYSSKYYLLSNYVIRCSIRGTSLYHILRRSTKSIAVCTAVPKSGETDITTFSIRILLSPIEATATTLYAVVYAVLRYIIYFVGVRKVSLYVLLYPSPERLISQLFQFVSFSLQSKLQLGTGKTHTTHNRFTPTRCVVFKSSHHSLP